MYNFLKYKSYVNILLLYFFLFYFIQRGFGELLYSRAQGVNSFFHPERDRTVRRTALLLPNALYIRTTMVESFEPYFCKFKW